MARWLALLLLQVLGITVAQGASEYRELVVADPYLELHTGPGRGYPVFYVVERGASVKVIKQRTDWYLVSVAYREGWVSREQMVATLELTGEPADLKQPTLANLATRRWEAGVMLGDFGGASLISLFVGYGISQHLSAELHVSDALGNISNQELATIGLVHTFAPEWRVSPYFGVGAGYIHTSPSATLVQVRDRTDQIGYAQVGVRMYLTRRFLARAEYRNNSIFTSRNNNEAADEWKAGFAFFF